MTRIAYITMSVLVATAMVFLTGCDKSDPTAKKEEVLTKLTAKTWTIKTATIDNVDKTTFFTGLSLTLTDGGYTTANGKIVWHASGTWSFTDDSATMMKRDDQVLVTIDEVTETQLVLRLSWAKSSYAPGRISSTSGVHVFTFN